MKLTGREPEAIARTEAYSKAQGLFLTPESPESVFGDSLELDLGSIVPSISGPKRPQDRIPLDKSKSSFATTLSAMTGNGSGTTAVPIELGAANFELGHGAVVIAAITSCTNTSNPSVMVAAGLLARNAVERGLNVQPWVKTSLAPGSRVVTDYLKDAGLLEPLEALRFHLVGYGCTTCIGNSGPLAEPIAAGIKENDLVVTAVLSGNRNFEGRISPLVKSQLPGISSAGRRIRYRRNHGRGHGQRASRRRQRWKSGVPEGHLADVGRDPVRDPPIDPARNVPNGL